MLILIIKLEIEIYNKLVSLLLQSSGNILILQTVARIDVLLVGQIMQKYGAVRPQLNDTLVLLKKEDIHQLKKRIQKALLLIIVY